MNQSSPARCYLVGGGIASLASAVYLIRDGHVPGKNIHLLEQSRVGGSLDAAGSPEHGNSMRGSRMFGPAYVLTHDLLDSISSRDDPAKSVTQDTFEFWQATPGNDKARLVENGQVADRRRGACATGTGQTSSSSWCGPPRMRWTTSASTSASRHPSSSRTSG